MAAKPKSPNLSPVVATLNRQQANALVAYLNLKKYHWLTYGPLFRDLHLLFDEQATLVYAMIDEFAERAIMLDGQPIGDPARYLPAATVKPSAGFRSKPSRAPGGSSSGRFSWMPSESEPRSRRRPGSRPRPASTWS